MADIQTLDTQQSKAIALKWATEGFKDRALRAELMAPDYVLHFCGAAEPLYGREVVNHFVDSTLHLGFPNVEQIVESAIADGDTVALRITYKGTHQGDFMGILATGNAISVTANMILKVANGCVAEEWTESNPMVWMQQLGALAWMQQVA